jgi:hypothetical protein
LRRSSAVAACFFDFQVRLLSVEFDFFGLLVSSFDANSSLCRDRVPFFTDATAPETFLRGSGCLIIQVSPLGPIGPDTV